MGVEKEKAGAYNTCTVYLGHRNVFYFNFKIDIYETGLLVHKKWRAAHKRNYRLVILSQYHV